MLNRRKLITGLISFVAAPAIVRASSLMPVKVYKRAKFLLPSDFSVVDIETQCIGYEYTGYVSTLRLFS